MSYIEGMNGIEREVEIMDETSTFQCPHCGAPVVVMVDISGGRHQEYVEDCQVCCQPCLLNVEFDDEGAVTVIAEQE